MTGSQVQKDFGEGRLVTADAALDRKMIDRVMTFDELMDRLTGRSSSGGGGGQAQTSTEQLRLRHEQRKREAGLI